MFDSPPRFKTLFRYPGVLAGFKTRGLRFLIGGMFALIDYFWITKRNASDSDRAVSREHPRYLATSFLLAI